MKNQYFWPAFIVVIGALCAAAVARAQDAVTWGGTACQLSPTPPHEASIAALTCSNLLVGGNTHNEAILFMQGFPVKIVATFGPGNVPDTFAVTVPDGFVAVPPEMTLDEGGSGTVLIFAMDDALLG